MDYDYDPAAERAAAYEQMVANRRALEAALVVKPFDFADLNGRPEPEKWGPCYPKTASAAVEKWRAIARGRELTPNEKRVHGQAVGEWISALNNPAVKRWRVPASDLHYHKHHTCAHFGAAARARVNAQAAVDRRQWALGQLKDSHGRTIREAYRDAMAAKRARLAALELELA